MRPNKNDKSASARWMGFREACEPEAQGSDSRRQRNLIKQDSGIREAPWVTSLGVRCGLLITGAETCSWAWAVQNRRAKLMERAKAPSQKFNYLFTVKRKWTNTNKSHHSNSWGMTEAIQYQRIKDLKLMEMKCKGLSGFPGRCLALVRVVGQ